MEQDPETHHQPEFPQFTPYDIDFASKKPAYGLKVFGLVPTE
jgi:hypothetical protein